MIFFIICAINFIDSYFFLFHCNDQRSHNLLKNNAGLGSIKRHATLSIELFVRFRRQGSRSKIKMIKATVQSQLSNQIIAKKRKTVLVSAVVTTVLVGTMALDTTVIVNGSADDLRQQVFSPDNYASAHYSGIRSYILENAVDATTLLKEIQVNKKAAGEKYGIGGGIGPVIPVSFKGTITTGKSGIFSIDIPNFPDKQTVRIQTGPAINGTDLRDATGAISFGEFTNQIEYQDVGAALNRAMKADILEDLDRSTLTGKSVEISGVFRLINTKNWLVTPVRMNLK
ncbi:MAG: putative lipoprotein [Marinomonas primoryensis]|jgi:predicted lipoprotein